MILRGLNIYMNLIFGVRDDLAWESVFITRRNYKNLIYEFDGIGERRSLDIFVERYEEIFRWRWSRNQQIRIRSFSDNKMQQLLITLHTFVDFTEQIVLRGFNRGSFVGNFIGVGDYGEVSGSVVFKILFVFGDEVSSRNTSSSTNSYFGAKACFVDGCCDDDVGCFRGLFLFIGEMILEKREKGTMWEIE